MVIETLGKKTCFENKNVLKMFEKLSFNKDFLLQKFMNEK